MDILSRAGRYCLGATVAASGLMQVITAAFVRLVPKLPEWVPVQPGLAIATGMLLILIGGAILTGYKIRVAAIGLAALLLGSFIFQRIPEIVANPGAGFMWTNPAKVLALFGGTLLVAGGTGRVVMLAAGLLGVFLLICGAQHFTYAGFVDTLVPAWIPPGPRFWTYFSAVALLAGGLGVVIPPTRKLAGILSGVMIFLWVLMLHIPLALKMHNAFELAGTLEALALAGVCWLVAGNSLGTMQNGSATPARTAEPAPR